MPCARASGLAHSQSPPHLHCDPSTCEGPPHLNNCTCRLRPIASQRKIAGGASTFTCPALPRDKWFRSGSCRSNWRNATTGQSGPTDSGETRQHVGIVLVIVLGINQCRDWILEDFDVAVVHRCLFLCVNHHGKRTDHGGSAGRFRICGE